MGIALGRKPSGGPRYARGGHRDGRCFTPESLEPRVLFAGSWTTCYRVNFWSRIASRVLWRIASFDYQSEQDFKFAARERSQNLKIPNRLLDRIRDVLLRLVMNDLPNFLIIDGRQLDEL